MAELVDAHDSKSCGVIHESSILSPGTKRVVYNKVNEFCDRNEMAYKAYLGSI